jgi:hypothetical protein
VEEQFYIVWPVTVWVIRSAVPRLRHSLPVLSVIIFASVWWARTTPATLSYMATQGRLYQLLLGALLAFVRHQSPPHAVSTQQQIITSSSNDAHHGRHEAVAPVVNDQRRRRPEADGLVQVEIVTAAVSEPPSNGHVPTTTTATAASAAAMMNLLTNVSFAMLLLCATSLSGPETSSTYIGVVSASLTFVLIVTMELRPSGGDHSYTEQLLTSSPMQLLGNYSYALYLWHWPVVVIGDATGWLPTEPLTKTVLVFLVTLALSWFSWNFVEQTATKRIPINTRRQQYMVAIGGFVCSILVAFLLFAILQVPASVEQLQRELDDPTLAANNGGADNFYWNATTGSSSNAAPTAVSTTTTMVPSSSAAASTTVQIRNADARCTWRQENCMEQEYHSNLPSAVNATSKQPNVLLLGDSFSLMWSEAMRLASQKRGYQFGFVAQLSCTWVCSEHFHESQHRRCCRVRPDVVRYVSTLRPAMLVLTTGVLLNPPLLSSKDKKPLQINSAAWIEEVETGAAAQLSHALQFTSRIVILEHPLLVRGGFGSCLATAKNASECDKLGTDDEAATNLRQIWRRLAKTMSGVVAVDPSLFACPNRICPARFNGGGITYRDDDHLSQPFAIHVMQQLQYTIFA